VKISLLVAIIALLIGLVSGYELKALNAASPVDQGPGPIGLNWLKVGLVPILNQDDPDHGCTPPKYWTGNGCADTSTWTWGDWDFFGNCIDNLPQPPTPAGVASCVQQTQNGHPR